ncbi:hypothetical protein [Streptomyces vietnamensis]|uniref:Aldolase n=1 Tax=Streptomyces vietnamensis TaxID=362257 RepID=A0A0B5IIL7_9ACTN|nr:hypothetical protein [Streptomyces vietnamensis]AJF70332.1 hypothetical protein SVTN_39625 [Streptomyces vietnamensis]
MGAVRITTADGQAVTVASQTDTVPAWAQRYLGGWWNAEPTTELHGPSVFADLDETKLLALAAAVEQGDAETVEYAGAHLLVVRDGQMVTAVQEDRSLAYRWDENLRMLRIVGTDETDLATAAARLARELVRAHLLADGWFILHASAVTGADGATILTLGDKGAGKTTTSLALARAGWRLLANDRIFARVDEHGVVRVLPWPSAAAYGFGLLEAHDLYEVVRTRLASGEQMHPTQHQKVTDALLAGRREPLWKANGKELKPQLWPDQLTSWLSMPLAAEGHAVGVLYPQITAGAEPRLIESDRGVQPGDFFDETTEDRYPDIFGLLPAPGDRTLLTEHLDALLHQGLVMNHDAAANAAVLKEAVARLGA